MATLAAGQVRGTGTGPIAKGCLARARPSRAGRVNQEKQHRDGVEQATPLPGYCRSGQAPAKPQEERNVE